MRVYQYVGPEEIREQVQGDPAGAPIASQADLKNQAARIATVDEEGNLIATFVVTEDGVLRIAPRESEHVACAGGKPVLAAGELVFTPGGSVVNLTNQSTGYCPDPTCWSAVDQALTNANIEHPTTWNPAFVFRRCDNCGERNVVKDGWFVCPLCDAELSPTWNF